jgi:hypothetical protein
VATGHTTSNPQPKSPNGNANPQNGAPLQHKQKKNEPENPPPQNPPQ